MTCRIRFGICGFPKYDGVFSNVYNRCWWWCCCWFVVVVVVVWALFVVASCGWVSVWAKSVSVSNKVRYCCKAKQCLSLAWTRPNRADSLTTLVYHAVSKKCPSRRNCFFVCNMSGWSRNCSNKAVVPDFCTPISTNAGVWLGAITCVRFVWYFPPYEHV